MALSFTKIKHDVTTAGRLHVYDVTFDNSYPTGGEVVTAGNFGLSTITAMIAVDKTVTAANNRHVTFAPATSALVVWTATGTQATNASDQSAVVVRCLAYGDNNY